MNRLKESQKKEAKNIIYRTAIELFRTAGYENTPIQAICSSCGIAKGTFYNYFASKEDIIRESFRNGIDEYLYNEMQNINVSLSPIKALRYFITASLNYCNIVGKKTTSLAYVCNLNSAMNDNENMLYDAHYDILKEIYILGKKNNSWKSTLSENEFLEYISAFINGLMISFCFSIETYDIVEKNRTILSNFIQTI